MNNELVILVFIILVIVFELNRKANVKRVLRKLYELYKKDKKHYIEELDKIDVKFYLSKQQIGIMKLNFYIEQNDKENVQIINRELRNKISRKQYLEVAKNVITYYLRIGEFELAEKNYSYLLENKLNTNKYDFIMLELDIYFDVYVNNNYNRHDDIVEIINSTSNNDVKIAYLFLLTTLNENNGKEDLAQEYLQLINKILEGKS